MAASAVKRGLGTIACALCLLALFPGVPALAATQPGQPGKDELLRAAAAKERAADVRGALDLLQQALAGSGDPLIEYDVGRLQQRLGNAAAAFRAFSHFITRALTAPPLYRDDAVRRMEKLRGQVRQITVDCNVAGASIFLDDALYGTAPLSEPVVFTRSNRQLRIEHPGHRTFTRDLAGLSEGAAVRATLEPTPTAMAVAPPPPPASGDAAPAEASVSGAAAATADENAGARRTEIAVAISQSLVGPSGTRRLTLPALGVAATRDLGGEALRIGVGAQANASWLAERTGDRDFLGSFLVHARLAHPLAAQWTGWAALGAGVVLMSGLHPDSVLLQPGAVSKVRSPGLWGFESRLALGVDYALSRRLALVVATQLTADPRPSATFVDPVLLRVDVGAGLRFAL
jgi:hypothetical protein